MEPEKIDELFRDKLSGHKATPSPDAWMRLQQKMEPPRKARTMWLYYAAASVAILFICGLLYLRNQPGKTGPAVATQSPVPPPVETKPEQVPAPAPEQQLAQAPQEQLTQAPKKQLAQAPAAATRPAPALAGKGRRPRALSLPAKVPAEAPALAASQAAPAKAPAAETTPGAAPTAAPDFSVVEVVITRGPEIDPDAEKSFREQLHRKGHLLKNIYQQARNLKKGEPVELASIGIDKNKIEEEKKELKQKISNVISL